MFAHRAEMELEPLGQDVVDDLLACGICIDALLMPHPVMQAYGTAAQDGLFEPDAQGTRWLAIEDVDDAVFWQADKNEFASEANRAFAIGETLIHEAATYAFDGHLNIFADPLTWLRAGRDGIVVLPFRWHLAFDRLRDAPRIAVAESILPLYRRHMRPGRMPELLVLATGRRTAWPA